MITVPEIEKSILRKMNYSERRLKLRLNYKKNGQSIPRFKKQNILSIFHELGYKPLYLPGGGYVIARRIENFLFEINCVNNSNAFSFFLNIEKDGKLIEDRESHTGAVLYSIGYDEKLANEANNIFGLNDLLDLRNYLKENLDLLNEFIDLYIEEIKKGNA